MLKAGGLKAILLRFGSLSPAQVEAVVAELAELYLRLRELFSAKTFQVFCNKSSSH